MSLLDAFQELLREIAEQQGGPPAGGRPPAGPPVARRVPPAKASPWEAVTAEVVEAEPVEAEPLRREAVAAHVAQHVNTGDIQRHTAQLGAEVALADDKVEARLQQKFDRAVGRLHGATQPPAALAPTAPPPAPAAEIAALLRNPTSVRQAIVLNEILTRPEHRW